jgi:hypothetical protein
MAPLLVWVLATVTALGLRLAYLLTIRGALLDEPPPIGMDRWLEMHIAEAVARGDWRGGWSADYDSGLAYGYLLGALYRAGGERWVVPLAVQAALGAATPVLLWALGRRLYSARVGVVAAALAAVYLPAIFYEVLLVKFALLPVTVAALLLALARARDRASAGRLLTAGLVAGVLATTRPQAVLLAPVLAWWLVRGSPGLRPKLRMLALAALGAALVVGPFVVRDRLVARSGGGSVWGIHFYIGTGPEADGAYVSVPGVREDVVGHVVDARRIAETEAGRPLSAGEVSLHWFRRGLAFVRAEPWRYARLELTKLRLALAGGEEGSFGDEYADAKQFSWVLRLPLPGFGAIWPFALVGIVVTLARRGPGLLPLFVAAYVASLLPFFVTGRYRLPIVPPMLVLAAVGLCAIESALAERRVGAVLGAVALAAAALVAVPWMPGDPWLALVVLGIGVGVAALAREAEPQSTT